MRSFIITVIAATMLVGCASTREQPARRQSWAPDASATSSDTPVIAPHDPEKPTWTSRDPEPEWIKNRNSIESNDLVVGHSSRIPSREAALAMARTAALQEAAIQIATDVRTREGISGTHTERSTAEGEMVGSSERTFTEEDLASARQSIVGSRVKDEYYERFWSPQSGWAWKAHVLLRFDYARSVETAQRNLTRR